MLPQGPPESTSPRWLPMLLALGTRGCPVPVPIPHPLYLALLRAGLLRADPEAGHVAVCLIYMHNYCTLGHFPCWQAVCCDTSHLLHSPLLLLLPPAILTVQRQVRTASWVSSGGTNPEEGMSTSSSLFQFNSSDSGSGASTTFQGDESQHNKFHSQKVHPGPLCMFLL